MDDEALRASDADRERVAAALREHLLAGRLTLEEFSDRVDAALRARVHGELSPLQTDLPDVYADVPHPHHRPARFTTAVFSHVIRRGQLRLRGWALAASVWGDIDLDLRDARIDRRRTTVVVLGVLGNADIYVPEGVNVDVRGLAIFGHLRDRGRDLGLPDAPTIQVRVIGVIATVDVWRVPRILRDSSYGQIFDALRGRRSELPGSGH